MVAKLEEKTAELFALHVLASTLARSLETGVILRESLEVLCQTLGFDAGRIFLLERKKQLLQLKAHRGISEDPAVEPSCQLEEGIIRQVADTGCMMIFEDIHADPKFGRPFGQEAAPAFGYHGYACFPIQIEGQVVGVADFLNRIPRRLTPREIQLIKSMLGQAGVAIKNAILFEEMTQKSAELEALIAINRDIASLLDREVLLPRICEEARRILKVDGISLRLIEGDRLVRVAHTGDEDLMSLRSTLGAGESLSGKIIQENRAIAAENILEDPILIDERREILTEAGYGSLLGVPLRVGNRTIGTINVYSKGIRAFGPDEISLVSALADQAAIAIQNADLFSQLKNKSVQLESAGRIKSEFLSVMSHELRTPLNAIMGYARLLEDKAFGEINPRQAQFPARILKNSQELLGMINAILEATRIEADAVRPDHDEVALRDLLDELRSFYEVALDKELALIWDYPPDLPRMRTDNARLKQILQNLINNAIKFTERGHVRMSARHLPENETVEFKVEDTGIGIARNSLAVIFEMFRQVDSSETRLYGGMGLGLYIVKKFTALLGGAIEVESEPGKGSIFKVSLPRRPER